jgi:periplasmic divalent cation tolerance protein
MTFIICYITYENKKQAKKIVSHLLDKKLIACANIFPMTSMYKWKGKIVDSKEVVSIVKTKNSNWNKLKKEVEKIHPYETPCIIKMSVSANKDFEDWVKKNVI